MIDTYTELLREIAKLASPPPGHVRVFRGQTKNYDKMLPSGLRGQIRSKSTWHYYAMRIAKDLLVTENEEPHPWDSNLLTFSEKEAMWVEAIAQHYGPGSRFLDVTRSLHVALWFALHATRPVKADNTLGPPGAKDPAQDVIYTESWTEYYKWDAGPGFLYVFDVPEYQSENSLQHGDLLDLSKARPIFSQSKRIQAQVACLIAADPTVDYGNLKSFFACDPIQVQWPMYGAPPLVNASTEEIFPDPSQDAWYERFISLPLTYQAKDAGSLSLARPLEVTLYSYRARDQMIEVLRRTKHVRPTRFEQLDTLTMDLSNSVSGQRSSFHLKEASHILLDTPIMSWLPAANSQRWNHGILAGDMSDNVETLDLATNRPCGAASLTNVYFEFCPMEVTGWEQLSNPNGKIEWLGGVWIVREGAYFAVQFFPRWLASRNEIQTVTDSFRYDYCMIDGKFWKQSAAKLIWMSVTGDKSSDMAFFTALAILRLLSPVKKADPFPLEEKSGENGIRVMIIPVRERVARLMRVSDSENSRFWYVARDVVSGEPFFFDPTAYLGTLLLESRVPWSKVDASDVRKDIMEQC